eukprot:10059448-Alexandrium_andersonii.AAC.1
MPTGRVRSTAATACWTSWSCTRRFQSDQGGLAAASAHASPRGCSSPRSALAHRADPQWTRS